LLYLAPSYHLVVNSRKSNYLFSQYIVKAGTDLRVSVEKLSETDPPDEPPYMRLRHRLAMPFSHLYARGFNTRTSQPLDVVVRFHERPPGELGAATLVALVLLFFVVPLAWLVSTGSTPHSDIPVFLLALPGASAALLGLNLDAKDLSNTSITTRVGLFMTLVTSGLATILYLAQEAERLKFRSADLSIIGMTIPIPDYLWLIICGVSAWNAIWLAGSLALRMKTYRNFYKDTLADDLRELRLAEVPSATE
jgi:hypothetical protein